MQRGLPPIRRNSFSPILSLKYSVLTYFWVDLKCCGSSPSKEKGSRASYLPSSLVSSVMLIPRLKWPPVIFLLINMVCGADNVLPPSPFPLQRDPRMRDEVLHMFDDHFLLPQDFDLAERTPVARPTTEEVDSLQNTELFEGKFMCDPQIINSQATYSVFHPMKPLKISPILCRSHTLARRTAIPCRDCMIHLIRRRMMLSLGNL